MKPFVISIGGGTSSGKTTVCEIISQTFGNNVTILKQDWYYLGGNQDTNFDHPSSIEFELLTNDLEKLLNWENIERPVYDFTTHSRLNKTVTVKPNKIIIVEGILIYSYENLRNLFDLKLFVDADVDTRYRRRRDRDIKERGRNIEDVDNRWIRDVKVCHDFYVEPVKQYCHAIINNDKPNLLEDTSKMVQIDMILVYINYKISLYD